MHNCKIKYLPDRVAEKEETEPLLRAWHWGMDCPMLEVQPWHSLYMPPHSSHPFSRFSFPLSHRFRPLLLNLFISAWYLEHKQFHWGERLLELRHTFSWAASFMGGVEGFDHICLWVWCCETLQYTRDQTGAPKRFVQPQSQCIFSLNLVNGCKLVGVTHWEGTGSHQSTGVNKASKTGTCKIFHK